MTTNLVYIYIYIYIYILPGGYVIYGETCLQRNHKGANIFLCCKKVSFNTGIL